MSGIGICDDGTEVIDVGEFGTVSSGGCGNSFFALFAVVEELSLEEVLDFVWDGGLFLSRVGIGERIDGRT